MKKAFERLISFHLVEKRDEEIDELGNFLWRWTYPTIENSVRNFIERRLYTKLMHSDHLASNDCDHSQGMLSIHPKFFFSYISNGLQIILIFTD